MPAWTFPVQINLARSPANAGEAQRIAAAIEEALILELADQTDDYDSHPVICMQPVEGTHRHTSCDDG